MAAWLIARLGYPFVYDPDKIRDHINRAIGQMGALLDDDEWIANWKDEAEIRDAVRKQIAELAKL